MSAEALIAFLNARLDEKAEMAGAIREWIAPHFMGVERKKLERLCDQMLREVEGVRKILAEHEAVTRLAGLTGQDLGFLGWYREWVLKNLAVAYADHPDYDQAWSTAAPLSPTAL